MALDSARLRQEGMLVLDELSMRGSALSCKTPLDGKCCTLWASSEHGGLLVLSLGATLNAWRGPGVASALLDNISAERVVILHELPLRNSAIDVDLAEDWEADCSLIRKLCTDAELLRCAASGVCVGVGVWVCGCVGTYAYMHAYIHTYIHVYICIYRTRMQAR
jgi:hypothetical protein